MRLSDCRPVRIEPLSARKRFGRYKDEKKSPVRDLIHEESEGFKSIMEAWMQMVNFPSMRQMFHDVSNPTYYAREALSGREYTAEDVTRFSIAVSAFQELQVFDAAGRFLSVLVDLGNEGHYLISTAGISAPMDVLAYRNNKNIEIDGDAGRWLGKDMGGGRILVKGDADDEAGSKMRDGLITIEGDSQRRVWDRL
jgi:hypothetical protein